MTAPRNRMRGFTLTEVLVGLALLAGMALIVSQVLGQASQVVRFSEAKIRQNNAALALGDALRDCFRKASKNGILCITQVGGRPRMILTTAGITPSLTGSAKGTAAFTCLGMVDNQDSPGDLNTRLLWLAGYVLRPASLGGTGTDVWSSDFAWFQSLTRRQVDGNVINHPFCTGTLANNLSLDLHVPANSLNEVNLLWQVAATNISGLSIQWTDGTRDALGHLMWYGPWCRLTPGGLVPGFQAKEGLRNAATLDEWNNLSHPEYDAGGGTYRVLWTHHNQNYWPKAIKVRFTFTNRDPAMPPEFQTSDYEVIGTIGQ